MPSHMFFKFNSALGPPYHVLLDTNFINFAIQNKLDIMQSAMTCLLAKCHIYITDCVMAELEKLGQQYRVALRYRGLTIACDDLAQLHLLLLHHLAILK